jgi:hypothetical protein
MLLHLLNDESFSTYPLETIDRFRIAISIMYLLTNLNAREI